LDVADVTETSVLRPTRPRPEAASGAVVWTTGSAPGFYPSEAPQADPAGGGRAGADPAGIEPAGIEPAGTDLAGTDPAGTDPAGTDPAGTDPDFSYVVEDDQPAVVAFRPRPELAAYLDAGPESSPFFDPSDDSQAASFIRRSRMVRGHSIPRLPRAKRPGTAPGA